MLRFLLRLCRRTPEPSPPLRRPLNPGLDWPYRGTVNCDEDCSWGVRVHEIPECEVVTRAGKAGETKER